MTTSVHPRLWNILLIALAVVIVIGLGLVAILARGAADPPRDNLTILEFTPDGTAHTPFTLETTADGFTLTCGESVSLTFQVRLDGYFSVAEAFPNWSGFHHITRERNTLNLHVDATGEMIFRINQEIAWRGTTNAPECAFSRLSD